MADVGSGVAPLSDKYQSGINSPRSRSASLTRRKRVAVIGSGIAGLVATWYISENHDVTVFEKQATLGMDSHGVDIRLSNGEDLRVDVPLRVFSETYYSALCGVYKETGIEYTPEDYSATFYDDGGEYFSYFNVLLGTWSLPLLNPLDLFRRTGSLRIVLDYTRFVRDARAAVTEDSAHGISFGQFLKQKGYSTAFTERFAVPMMAAMLTCTNVAVCQYPADIILEYLVMRSLKGVRRAIGGSKEVCARLTSRAAAVHCGATVHSVKRVENGKRVSISYTPSAAKGSSAVPTAEVFDEVVFATLPQHAAEILVDMIPEERRVLGLFHSEQSAVVMHTDAACMPPSKSEWASVNFYVDKDENWPQASILMNRVHPKLANEAPIVQTWNPLVQPRKSTIISESRFDRPVMDSRSREAVALLDKMQGSARLWFCGSYSLYGMPLLENACLSALRVAESFGSSAAAAARERAAALHDQTRMGIPGSASYFSGGFALLMAAFAVLFGGAAMHVMGN